MNLFHQLEFFTTVNDLHTLPLTAGEVAFAGRSNAGKSSAINTLSNRTRLAYVSKTPGRTQHINYFLLKNNQHLVDLPGYGYAQVPDAVRQHWEGLLGRYLQTRHELCGLVLLMDARHPLKELDKKMLSWFTPTGKPVHVLLTKSDKLNRQESTQALRDVRAYLKDYPKASVQLFSSLKKIGVDEVAQVVSPWLEAALQDYQARSGGLAVSD